MISRTTRSLRYAAILAPVLIANGSRGGDFVGPPVEPAHELIRDFAGTYYQGDGLGMNLRLDLRADGAVFYKWTGCLGVYDHFTGVARVEGKLLVIAAVPGRPGIGRRPGELVPIRWGERRYLVSKDEMPAFCKAVNDGEEPRLWFQGSYYLRATDIKSKPAGPPSVPRPWRDLLKVKPADELAAIGVGAPLR